MPLFGLGSKFSPKSAPLRRNFSDANAASAPEELFLEDRVVHLTLGGNELVFQDGEWMPADTGTNGSIQRTYQKLKKRVQELEEENNMLRLKYTVMLNLLTQTTAESHLQERELQKLRQKNKS